jgi:hypothetical protein
MNRIEIDCDTVISVRVRRRKFGEQIPKNQFYRIKMAKKFQIIFKMIWNLYICNHNNAPVYVLQETPMRK